MTFSRRLHSSSLPIVLTKDVNLERQINIFLFFLQILSGFRNDLVYVDSFGRCMAARAQAPLPQSELSEFGRGRDEITGTVFQLPGIIK